MPHKPASRVDGAILRSEEIVSCGGMPTPGRSIYCYRVHGLIIASEIELPELAARSLTTELQPDVYIHIDHVARPDRPLPLDPVFVTLPGGAAFLEVPDVARYLVTRGWDVIVDPAAQSDPALIRAVLLGWVMAMICLQRDLLVLHASAVAFGDRVIAFMGDAGAGKSTLAAHCLAAGARLVADDMLRVTLRDQGCPRVHPGMPILKLWQQAIEGLGRSSEGLTAEWWRGDKFLVPFPAATVETELPLARICVLEQDPAAPETYFERLTGAAAVTALVTNSHGVGALDALGVRANHFRDCAELANRVEVVRLRRPHDPRQLPLNAARIAAELSPTD
jgi:hypothetical protein